jgi:hypothetical protein
MRRLIVLLPLALASCQLAARRPSVAQAEVDEARLHTADADVYEPSLRILDLPGGRTRLIVQDPETHHYRVVGGW